MSEWVNANQKLMVYIFIILFLGLVAFYLYIVRPVSLEVNSKEAELTEINSEIQTLESTIAGIEPIILSEVEQERLLSSVPIRPNVEQIIADLEKTELETGAVIDNVEVAIVSSSEITSEGEQSLEADHWQTIFPEDVYPLLTDKIEPIKDVTLSYVDMIVTLNGLEKDVHLFVSELEKLERAVHVQSYLYLQDSEAKERVTATVAFRSYYSEDFSEFIEDDPLFQLDYQFDATKINRYFPPPAPVDTSYDDGTYDGTIDGDNGGTNNATNDETNNGTNNGGTVNTGQVDNSNKQLEPKVSPVAINPNFDPKPIYQKPSDQEQIKDGDTVFYIVQTGAYTNQLYLNLALQSLTAKGYYPIVQKNSLNLIFTAISGNGTAAMQKAQLLTSEGFQSFSKAIPYRGEEALSKDVSEVVAVITDVSSYAFLTVNYSLTEETFTEISMKIEAYETQVNEMIAISQSRKQALEDTIYRLMQVKSILKEYQTSKDSSILWEVEGLILEFVLLVNGHQNLTISK